MMWRKTLLGLLLLLVINGGCGAPTECEPSCSGRLCGESDGCGGRCTRCLDAAKSCDESTWTCEVGCVPSCIGKTCGASDGCGGKCTACANPDETCNQVTWQCGCTPECGANACGVDDGCGGQCTTCAAANEACNPSTWQCECTPECGGDSCGEDDGCGGVCTSCADSSLVCDATAGCIDPATYDGVPTRQACISSGFGTALTSLDFGRLDGILVAVVAPARAACNADSDHLHLQVKANNAIYDVAVNIHSTYPTPSGSDVYSLELDHALVGGSWSEGWHGSVTLDYVDDLGVSSDEFALTPRNELVVELQEALATVNHISIYGLTYDTRNGLHDIHYYNPNADGALVMRPLAANPHYVLFRFYDDSF